MCTHQTPCPSSEAVDREAARTLATFPEQGWSLLCNGVIVFEDTPAKYTKRLDLMRFAAPIVAREFSKQFDRALTEALASAR